MLAPRPHYTFQELFEHLVLYRQYQGKWPTVTELDPFNPDADLQQPMAIMLVSPKKTWHIPIMEDKSLKTFTDMIMNKEKYQNINAHIFTEINQEAMKPPPEGQSQVLKFKLVFSLNRCPESVHEGELAQRF